MNRTKLYLSLIAGMAGLVASSFAQTGRIVTADMQKIFDTYYKTPIARGKLEETRDSFTKELQTKQDALKKAVDELNKLKEEQDRPEYTPEVREQKKKALNEKLADLNNMQRDMQEYQRSHQRILEEQSLRMRQSILKEITDVVTKEAKDAGYMLVLDKSGNTLNGLPSVVYSQEPMDITADIIKILNKDAPATPAATPAPAAPKPEEKK